MTVRKVDLRWRKTMLAPFVPGGAVGTVEVVIGDRVYEAFVRAGKIRGVYFEVKTGQRYAPTATRSLQYGPKYRDVLRAAEPAIEAWIKQNEASRPEEVSQ